MRYFNRITLRTPESVELEFTLAGIGNRALALAIDYTLLIGLLLLFWVVWLVFSSQLFDYLNQLQVNYSPWLNWLIAIAALVTFFIWVGYFVYFETLWQGQTPGKRIARIRVIRDDGRPIRLPQAILRAMLRPVDDVLSIGVWLIIFNQQEKRIGDWVAGTIVVQNERPVVTDTLQLSGEAEAIAAQLLDIADLSLLLPDDFAVIREYLQRRSAMDARARATLSLQLARQAKDLIALQQLPLDMTPDHFLEGVYLAYQQQSSQQDY